MPFFLYKLNMKKLAVLILLLLGLTGAAYGDGGFYITPITEGIYQRIIGKSLKPGALIKVSDLRYVHVLHVDFDGNTASGELICNRAVADDIMSVFMELYEAGYPIEKIRLVDEYDADDELSMQDNNSSCFNYRVVKGTTRVSNHGKGAAVDINPLYNPCVRVKSDGQITVEPADGLPYTDRSRDFPHKIDENDICYRIFKKYGFQWGGSWSNPKDYQHFEKIIR